VADPPIEPLSWYSSDAQILASPPAEAVAGFVSQGVVTLHGVIVTMIIPASLKHPFVERSNT
jgi:hypothetical protein